MKALTLHQPWATLCVTRQPDRGTDSADGGTGMTHAAAFATSTRGDEGSGSSTHPRPRAVKWIETRSWPAPAALIGQRIAIHASKEPPPSCLPDGSWPGYHDERGWWTVPDDRPGHVDLPLGAVVGSAVLTACVPMVDPSAEQWPRRDVLSVNRLAHLYHWSSAGDWRNVVDVSDQLPFGIFEPGRWAWLLADAAPTTERCPWCWGEGEVPERVDRPVVRVHVCPVCSGAGRCDPIPARGRQRVWEWTPCG